MFDSRRLFPLHPYYIPIILQYPLAMVIHWVHKTLSILSMNHYSFMSIMVILGSADSSFYVYNFNIYILLVYIHNVYIYIYGWRFPEMGVPLNHPSIYSWIFHYKPSIFGCPCLGNPHIYIYICVYIYIYVYMYV